MAERKKNKTKKTSSAEIVGSVDDLLLEIFRRVPSENIDRNNPPLFKLASKHLKSLLSYYRPLIRLRLVSRRWNSLISNNFFQLRNPKPVPAAGLIFECRRSRPRHITTTTAHPSYILFLDQSISTSTTTAPFRDLNPVDDPWHYRSKVVHSCNGLLLCASERTYRVYSVCNPTTGKHSTLPQVPPVDFRNVRGAYLAFDPCKSPHYKVVCVLALGFDNQFVVYSSETGCWGNCGELFMNNNVGFGNHNNNGVYWNGAIHWVGSSQLICFNPDDDQLAPPEVMPMPIARNYHQSYYLGESYGHLHYIGLDDGVREVVVHEMRSDYSGWVVKYKFDVTNALTRINNYLVYEKFEVYAVVRGERAEDMFLVLGTSFWIGGDRRRIVRFNQDATFETIYDFTGSKNPLENPNELHPFQYIESLASV